MSEQPIYEQAVHICRPTRTLSQAIALTQETSVASGPVVFRPVGPVGIDFFLGDKKEPQAIFRSVGMWFDHEIAVYAIDRAAADRLAAIGRNPDGFAKVEVRSLGYEALGKRPRLRFLLDETASIEAM